MANTTIVELNVCAPPELTDPISSFLVDQDSGGVIIEDIESSDNLEDRKLMGWQWIRAYFPQNELSSLKKSMATYLGELHQLSKNSEPPFIVFRDQPVQDWAQAWKAFFKPVEICSGITIKPSWEVSGRIDESTIVLDPGMAFGTGAHPTTRLASACIKHVLDGNDDSSSPLGIFSMLDIGCGSGVLSLLGAKLGVPRILGIDVDPTSVEAANSNVVRNGLQRKVTINDELLEDVFETFDLVVANIIAGTLISLRDDIIVRANRGGYIVLSGILRNQGSRVKDEFLKSKVEFVTTVQEDQWCSLVFRKI